MTEIDRDKLRRLCATAEFKSPRAVSLAAGLGATAIKDILSGKSRTPAHSTVKAIADVLHVPIDELIINGAGALASEVKNSPGDVRYLPVRFTVQAGHWVETEVHAQVFPAPSQPVAENRRYASWPQWLEHVVGDSINLKIPDGGFAHVVDAIEMGYRAKDGDFVVVERIRNGGQLRERSIKQVVVTPTGRVELWPRSTNPLWSTPLSMTEGSQAGEEVEVRIVGFVIGAYSSFV